MISSTVLSVSVLAAAAMAQVQTFPSLGADLRTATAAESQRYGLEKLADRPAGLIVAKVSPQGRAADAGMKAGDILLKAGNCDLYSLDDLNDVLSAGMRQETVKAIVLRDGKQIEIALSLGKPTIKPKTFTWDYASRGQLEGAQKEAERSGKAVLIGISGAET